jgi:hypothetical protein
MSRLRARFTLMAAVVLGVGCAHFASGTAAGNILDSAEASKTVVLHVENLNSSPMELRATVNGRSEFVWSVGGNDTTSILLDARWFPTASMYVVGITPDGRGRAVGGPLAAAKGDRIMFMIQPALETSNAIVRR